VSLPKLKDWFEDEGRNSIEGLLEKLDGKSVTLHLKNGALYSGLLNSFDMTSAHTNIVVLSSIEGKEMFALAIKKSEIIAVSARKNLK
jgi:small nuclear ribonucleoprotein (snRNP)-like protein